MTRYFQPVAAALVLFLSGGFASASTVNGIGGGAPPPLAGSSTASRPIVLAQVPDVQIQLGGDRERDRDRRMDRRDQERDIVIVPRRDRDTSGSGRNERRDRDYDRRDRD